MKPALVFTLSLLLFGSPFALSVDGDGAPAKKSAQVRPEGGEVVGSKKGSSKASPTSSSSSESKGMGKAAKGGGAKESEFSEGNEPLRIPVLEGDSTLGLAMPEMQDGKLRSFFSIEKVSRVSERKVRMEGGYLEFFEEDGGLEFAIELSDAVIEEDTRMIVATVPVTVRKPTFELTGMGLEFDTRTRQGGLKGPVKMLIFSDDSEEPETK